MSFSDLTSTHPLLPSFLPSLTLTLILCCCRQSPRSNASKFAAYAAVLFTVFFFLSLGSGNSNETGDSLRSGQAKLPTIHQTDTSYSLPDSATIVDESQGKVPEDKDLKDFDKSDEDGDFVNERDEDGDDDVELDENEIEEQAETFFTGIVERQVANNQNSIATKIDLVMDNIKKDMKALFEKSEHFDVDEAVYFHDIIKEKLATNVTETIEKETHQLLLDKITEFELRMDLEDDEGESNKEIEKEISKRERKMEMELTDGVDDICNDIRNEIKHLGSQKEGEVLKVELENKTGHSYEVSFGEDDKITGFKRVEKMDDEELETPDDEEEEMEEEEEEEEEERDDVDDEEEMDDHEEEEEIMDDGDEDDEEEESDRRA